MLFLVNWPLSFDMMLGLRINDLFREGGFLIFMACG